jgi:hypothetical protein
MYSQFSFLLKPLPSPLLEKGEGVTHYPRQLKAPPLFFQGEGLGVRCLKVHCKKEIVVHPVFSAG